MSDDPNSPSEQLVLRVPGSIGVFTPAILSAAARLHEASQRIAALAMMLLGASYLGTDSHPDGMPGASARDAREGIEHATRQLFTLSDEVAQVATDLISAGELYGWAEKTIDASIQGLTDVAARALGHVFAPVVGVVALGSLVGRWFGADKADRTGEHAAPFDAEESVDDGGLSAFLATPFAVDAVRHGVSAGDDFLAGALGPWGFAMHPVDGGSGVAGTAAVVAGIAGGYGALLDTRVSVKAVRTETATAPSGFAENIDQIPRNRPGEDGVQIMVERIEKPGEPPSFATYIAGTQSFDPMSKDQPFDMTSNVLGVAGLHPGAYQAVELALAQAGATSESKVSFIGHSQGGLLAQLLAASGDYDAQSVVTIGSPGGEVRMPDSVSATLIDNAEDLVPSIGGGQVNDHELLVERAVFAGAASPPENMAVPAHHFDFYKHTAELLDNVSAPAVEEFKDRLDSVYDGAISVTKTYFVATRVDDDSGGGGGGGGGR